MSDRARTAALAIQGCEVCEVCKAKVESYTALIDTAIRAAVAAERRTIRDEIGSVMHLRDGILYVESQIADRQRADGER